MTEVAEPATPPALEPFDLETVYDTAESIVQDILQSVAAGPIDDRTRTAFCDRIVDAWLTQPTAAHIQALSRAAGFAGPVDADTLQARVEELHARIGAQLHELGRWTQRYAVLHAAAQAVVDTWKRGALAEAVQQLAVLISN